MEVWDSIHYAELFRQGLPPVHGGALDQAAIFDEAARFIWSEQATWRTQMGLKLDA